jgi:hypothetical protein
LTQWAFTPSFLMPNETIFQMVPRHSWRWKKDTQTHTSSCHIANQPALIWLMPLSLSLVSTWKPSYSPPGGVPPPCFPGLLGSFPPPPLLPLHFALYTLASSYPQLPRAQFTPSPLYSLHLPTLLLCKSLNQ